MFLFFQKKVELIEQEEEEEKRENEIVNFKLILFIIMCFYKMEINF